MSQAFPNLSLDEARELVCLVPLLRDQAVPAAQLTRLEELVCRRDDGAWTYLKAMNVVAGLQWCFAPQSVAVPGASPDASQVFGASNREMNDRVTGRSVRRIALGRSFSLGPSIERVWRVVSDFFGRTAVGSAAVVAIIFYGTFAILAWNLTAEPSHDFSATDEQLTASIAPMVAQLTATHGCVWEPTMKHPSLNVDAEIRSGERLALRSGIAEIEFAGGTKIIVEGPSRFDLQSTNEMRLQTGKLTARVSPRAVGFIVDTPHAKIVDLGTEFGLKVASNGAAEVHVLQGAIAAEVGRNGSQSTRTLRVTKGEGVRIPPSGISPDDTVERIVANADQFVRELPSRTKSARRRAHVSIEAGDGTRDFKFPTITSPSKSDLADTALREATVQAIGQLHLSLPVTALIDGRGASDGHVRFAPGQEGKILLDFGRRMPIGRVNTYSWHVDGPPTGATQTYELFGSPDDQPPSTEGNLLSRGWKHIASVNTEPVLGRAPDCASQQAVSISAEKESLGEFRHLLWLILPLRQDTTYFEEFDVYESTH